jgi:L-malate glycosyltransferase
MKKILVVHVIDNLNGGGAEKLLLNICKGVIANSNRIEFRILLLEDKTFLGPHFLDANISFEVLDLKSDRFFHKIKVLTSRLRELRPSIVHSHLIRTDQIAPLSAFLARVPFKLSTIHSTNPNMSRYFKVGRKMASIFCDTLIAVSNSAKEVCAQKSMYPVEKMKVICNAPGFIPSSKVSPRNGESCKRMIHVGRLHESKGQVYLIRALRKVLDKGLPCNLVILGEGGDRQLLEELICKLNLKENAQLIGFDDDVEKHLLEADFFVASSLWEGLPLAQIEGMMMGVPLIATNIPAHVEILGGNKDLIISLAEPANIESLAESIEQALNLSSDDYTLESKRVIEQSQRYSMDKMIEEYILLYTMTKDS